MDTNTLDPNIDQRQREAAELAEIAQKATIEAGDVRRERIRKAYAQPQQEVTPDTPATTQPE